MHLPAGSSPGTKNYLCLQIAFDSRELFLWPANRSGDENYPVSKLGIQGRQMKMQRSGSQKPWDLVSALRPAESTESLAGAWDGSAAEQETGWGVRFSWPLRVALTSLELMSPKKAQQRVPWPLGYSLVNPAIVEPEAVQPWANRKD